MVYKVSSKSCKGMWIWFNLHTIGGSLLGVRSVDRLETYGILSLRQSPHGNNGGKDGSRNKRFGKSKSFFLSWILWLQSPLRKRFLSLKFWANSTIFTKHV
jgi:hypothetical protein